MVNPGEFVGGAALGAAVSLVCDSLIDTIHSILVFKSTFKDIESRLQCLSKGLQQMIECDQKLSYTDTTELTRLKNVLEDGRNLVDKCIEIWKWNLVQKCRYNFKLKRWEEDFKRVHDSVLMLGVRDGKMTGVAVKDVDGKVENVMGEVKNVKDSTGKIEVMTGNIEAKIEVSTQKLDNIEVSTRKIEAKIEVSTQKLDAKFEKVIEKFDNMEVKHNQIFEVFKPLYELPELPSHPVGLDDPLNELKEKLFEDGLSKLVLTGPAGCGKTTLVSKFCRDEEVKDKFKDNIIFVTITKHPKMDDIVHQLYQQKGKKVPAFTNANTLVPTFLREEGKSPLLLVLDHVCVGSESLLQMFDLGMTDYKVLVTSTSQFEGFGAALEVNLLGNENAMELFGHHASLGATSRLIPTDVAEQIVNHCGGFPVALKLVGESLCGKDISVWRSRLTQWSRGSSSIYDNQLLYCLQSSIDELDKVAMKCFLDFGLFPQSKYIPVATLFDMWEELYDLQGDHECIAKLYELSSRSLAKFVHGREMKIEANGYYSQHFVIQNGLLRKLAIYISTQAKKKKERKRLIIEICGDPPRWMKKQKCRTMQARLLSISTDAKLPMKWPDICLPEAEVLVLIFQTLSYSLPEFVEKMEKLKVLVITCTCEDSVYGNNLERWIHSQNQLSNLKTIILEGISIPSLTRNWILLESVKKISLSRCYKVSEAFRGSVKISDIFPNLEVLNIDFCNVVEPPAGLDDLTLLRELNITNCCGLSTLPEGMEKLVNLEVLRLRFCRDFSKFPHSMKLQRLRSIDLAYCPSIKELPKDIGEVSSLTKLDTRNCSELNELPPSLSDLDLKHLVVICSSKTKLLTESILHGIKIPMVAPTLEWVDFNG